MDHHDDDNRWDYDCPQYVDFTVPMPFNDGADQMFDLMEHWKNFVDTRINPELNWIQDDSLRDINKTIKASRKSTIIGEGPSTSTLQFLNQGVVEASPAAPKETKQDCHTSAENRMETNIDGSQPAEKQEEATEQPKKPKQLNNIVTSLEEWRNPKKHGSTGPDESPNSKKACKDIQQTATEMHKMVPATSMLTRSKSLRIQKSSSTSSLSADKTTAPRASSSSRPGRSQTRKFSHERSSSMDGKSKGDNSSTARPVKIPSLLKRLGESVTSSKLKSTEELEMERIKQLKKELQHKRQMAQESYKKALKCKGPLSVHSKDPTVPEEFHFETNRRLKSQTDRTEEKGTKDFVKSLRFRTVVSPGPSTAPPRKLTVPQPFHLTEKCNSKGLLASSDTKFESMAEKVTAFHKKTPERFRARARSGEKTQERGARSVSPGQRLTQPRTPNLTARSRHRPTHFLSQEQLEMQEVQEMKQSQFKARPVNTKILANPGIGVKKVPTKPLTKIEEFSLSTGVQKKKEAEESFEFHAQPLNKKILEGPVGVKPVKPALPTVPQSPAFALKHRVRLPVELPEEKVVERGEPVCAKPVPHTGIPFQPKLPHQHTVPEPFSVEERSKAMLAQKEEKIKQILEEEKKAREFRAQPIPSHDPVLPEKIVKESTKPEPFQLETDQRGMYYAQELAHKVGNKQLTEEEEELKTAAQFRAQPNRTIYKDPFVPIKSSKALTEVSDFELNSDRRAIQREEFEMRKKEREAELEGHRRLREQRAKEEEEAAIAKLRAEMVHHPNPIRHYAPMLIKPSDKPLTEAESPQFSDRLRTKVRL